MADAQEFLNLAVERYTTVTDAEQGQRKEGKIDIEFLNLEQWDPAIKNARSGERPCLVVDQIGEPFRQMLGRQRAARPSILVHPVDDGADIDTARVYQELIRNIEIQGGAKVARNEAFKGAIGPGWGYYRLTTEHEYDGTADAPPESIFDQRIGYQPIDNQFSVFFDPATPLHQPWKAQYCLIVEDLSTKEFQARYPDRIATQQEAFQATGIEAPDWFPEGTVRVADYFYVVEKEGPAFALLDDQSVVPADQVPEGAVVVQERRVTLREVQFAKITAAEILVGNDKRTGGQHWPGLYIPVIPMYGESITLDGSHNLRGMVRAARDPQRMYNYQNSALVEELALSPRSKVIMAEGQDQGYETMWKDAAIHAFPALIYKPTSVEGIMAPAPTVAQFTDPMKIQAMVVAINQHKSDLRSTTGWYDPTDPSRMATDQSGMAVHARQEAQLEGSLTYQDNFARSLEHEARVLLDLIPKIYTRPGRVLRLTGLDDEEQRAAPLGTPYEGEENVQRIYAWGAGRYDVTVSVGASHATRRQESSQFQMEVMKLLPPPIAASMAPDLIRSTDAPGAREVAEKVERALPPELQPRPEGQPDLPPELMQQMQQAQQMIDELTQRVEMQGEIIRTEQIKAEAELQKTRESDRVKVEVARLQAESQALKVRAELITEQVKVDQRNGAVMLAEETKRLAKLADLETSTRDISSTTVIAG